MKFAICGNRNNLLIERALAELVPSLLERGYDMTSNPAEAGFVLNCTDLQAPKYVRRRSENVFVFGIATAERYTKDLKSSCYNALVGSLSNLFLCFVPAAGGGIEVYFTTPEAGFYHLPFDPVEVGNRFLPMAHSRFATRNVITEDLPEQYHRRSPVVEQIRRYGRELDELGVLPTPFRLDEILSNSALRHLYRIYGITGASYGNLSAREDIPEYDQPAFWMTGRGVNKAAIEEVGKDVLLVTGFDLAEGSARVSVPPGTNPKARVSVDAVEHYLIYTRFPETRAIVHAHAWIDGVPCTRQNYPCGTRELAEEVVELLATAPDPASAAVGLKNHGLTITGRSLDEIFRRIRTQLKTQVAMFA